MVSDTFLENPYYSSFLLLETILVCGLFLIFPLKKKTVPLALAFREDVS